MEPIYRKMQATDWQTYQEMMEPIFPDNERSDKEFQLHLKDDFSGLFIDDKQIGNLLIKHYEDNSHLHNIGVHQEFQGQGYGLMLMKIALDHCKQNGSKFVILYVEKKNEPAIALYRKFNFKVVSESWHFIIDIQRFQQNWSPHTINYELKPISCDTIDILKTKFPTLDITQVQKWLGDAQSTGSTSNQFLCLYKNDEIKLFVRFNANFSGCMPLKFLDLEDFDIFVTLMIKDYILPEKDILRLTFDDYKDLANLLSSRREKLHHHLFKMRADLD